MKIELTRCKVTFSISWALAAMARARRSWKFSADGEDLWVLASSAAGAPRGSSLSPSGGWFSSWKAQQTWARRHVRETSALHRQDHQTSLYRQATSHQPAFLLFWYLNGKTAAISHLMWRLESPVPTRIAVKAKRKSKGGKMRPTWITAWFLSLISWYYYELQGQRAQPWLKVQSRDEVILNL